MHTVIPFSESNLIELCLTDWARGRGVGHRLAVREREQVAEKRQLRYLARHLSSSDLGCRTMVVQRSYMDLSYLDDYATYYARCHAAYGRKCVRVHFFRTEFGQAEYDRILGGDDALRAILLEGVSYLGFTVLKPLPSAFIGRTCVVPYGRDGADADGAWRRHFPALQACRAHVAGTELSVHSMPFQEQDTAVAACATTAIWCALQNVSPLFGFDVPSPAQITQRATAGSGAPRRAMPSQGLTVGEMCRALTSTGLGVEVLDDHRRLLDVRQAVHAYASFGLPVILGLRDPRAEPRGQPDDDGHAVVVCGYAIDAPSPGHGGPEHRRLSRLYVHDDTIGPFVRVRFDAEDPSGRLLRLPDPHRLGSTLLHRVHALVIPVHPLMRVREEAIREAVLDVEPILFPPPADGHRQEPTTVAWDVRLAAGHEVAAALRGDDQLTISQRALLAAHDWPRFVWQATAWSGPDAILDVFADATDIERSFLPTEIVLRSPWRSHLSSNWRRSDWWNTVAGRIHWPDRVLSCLGRELDRLGSGVA